MLAPEKLTWENVTIEVKNKKTREMTKILQNVTGEAKAGRMNIIMGPSGSGKSTLINTLSGHVPFEFKTSGKILIDGRQREEDFNAMVGISDQQDSYFDHYTAEKFLYFHACGKNRTLSTIESYKRIDSLLKRLHLDKKRNTLVSKLSGGERKRLLLISELMTDKKIFFLDEPTSGLDSHLALDFTIFLKEVTQKNNLIMFVTIHQPSPTIVNMFDDFTFIVQGKVLYHGEYSQCEKYFAGHGFVKPSIITFTEYLFELTTEKSCFDEISVDLSKVKSLMPPDADSCYNSTNSFLNKSSKISLKVIIALLKRELSNYFAKTGILTISALLFAMGLYFYAIYGLTNNAILNSNTDMVDIVDHIEKFYVCILILMFYLYPFVMTIVNARSSGFILKNRNLIISEVKNNSYSSIELVIVIHLIAIILSMIGYVLFLGSFMLCGVKFGLLMIIYFLPYVLLLAFFTTCITFTIPVISSFIIGLCSFPSNVYGLSAKILVNTFSINIFEEKNYKIFLGFIYFFFFMPHSFYFFMTQGLFLKIFVFNNKMDEIKDYIEKIVQKLKKFEVKTELFLKDNLFRICSKTKQYEIKKMSMGIAGCLGFLFCGFLVWNMVNSVKKYSSLAYRYKLEK